MRCSGGKLLDFWNPTQAGDRQAAVIDMAVISINPSFEIREVLLLAKVVCNDLTETTLRARLYTNSLEHPIGKLSLIHI